MTERQFNTTLEERDFYKEQYERLRKEKNALFLAVKAADRFCACLNEFGAEELHFCSECLNELEKALEASREEES